ncbi:hypothetical protein [Litorivivens lipolytica]|uniref:hypothetical protein n=1 Tax=Litorivivens lipolytica TaxID=1524264 RepID=UPI001611E7EF|nr:hypothetical protein [Litorivivens lipolytica]
MGQEIQHSEFSDADFHVFAEQLSQETQRLADYLRDDCVEADTGTCGLELEACLIDSSLRPAPDNEAFIALLDDPLVVPELAKFNFELNTPPFPVAPNLLSAVHSYMKDQWQRCQQAAHQMNLDICQVGILPSLRDDDLNLNNVSARQRYIALNHQILKGRQFRPLDIAIEGAVDHLRLEHNDVMTEAATTSLQIHLQVAPSDFARYYNASLLASALLVAAGANAPLVFEQDLWDESRVPLFEQSVALPCFISGSGTVVHRVTFGSGYCKHSAAELFQENLQAFPVLLPILDDERDALAHLQLHNGTIWRWNRPLVHINTNGQLQLRLEHRSLPAGPTTTDSVANIALFYGLVAWLSNNLYELNPPNFEYVRQNFYTAARWGLDAELDWLDGRRASAADILLHQGLPAAIQSLTTLGFDGAEVDYFLSEVMRERIARRRTGAHWQREFFLNNHRDTRALMEAYQYQCTQGAVHTW